MTKETLESWYVPKTEEEKAAARAKFPQSILLSDMTAEEALEIKLDHLMGDADDAEREDYSDEGDEY